MCSSWKMLPLAFFNLAWEEGASMPYVLQVIGFERFLKSYLHLLLLGLRVY